jgi:hypothetical protein
MFEDVQFENGDKVKEKNSSIEVFIIVETRGDGLYKLQLGNDAANIRYCKADQLELVAKAEKPKIEPGLYPSRSIMD